MRTLGRERYVNELSPAHPAAYEIEEGETVVVQTNDCHGGVVTREGVLPPNPPPANPATGPIEVKGAQPGEALAVTIHEVKPADWGFIGGGGEGERFTVVDLSDGIATYPWGLQLPVKPIIGVIGLAPPEGSVPNNTPSDWGGNLDTVDICAGATIYLPVAVPGGMLALGDVHALQGDGECCGTGIECAAEVTLTARRVKAPLLQSVYLVRGEQLMVLAHGDTLDEAAWGAVDVMAGLLSRLTGLTDTEARRLLSTAGDIRISQIVNPKKTCRAVIPRRAIPEHWPFA